MQEEPLLLSQRDRDRLKVLHEVAKKHITQVQAAEQLKLSDRWIRELVGRIEDKGDKAIIHGSRGRPSPHKIPDKKEKRAMEIVTCEYADFGPSLVSEYLRRDHGIEASRETVRQWMMRAQIWRKHARRIEPVHVFRPRRSCFGELVQWDTSDHDWLEGRGERLYLIGMLDDATSRGRARFTLQDSTAENMRLLRGWVEKHGRFVDAYTDHAGLFETNRPHQHDEERDGKLTETQIGRALRELGIGWIGAHSPQAKGRIERFFETAQDRLVKGMRKAQVRTLAGANQFLEEEYLPLWNERFTVRPASEVDAHRPLGKQHDLASILSHVEQRVIGQDYTIRYGGRIYQVVREQIRPGLKGQRVRVEVRLDGSMVVLSGDCSLAVKLCEGAVPRVQEAIRAATPRPSDKGPKANRARQSCWMKGFHVHSGPSLEQAIAHAYGEPWEEDEGTY